MVVHIVDGRHDVGRFLGDHYVAERLRPGGRFVLGDVVVPEDPADVVTPVDGVNDMPSSVAQQLRWLDAARLVARVVWARQDLAVIVADSGS